MGISTHVLDTTIGKPAVGVAVSLERGDSSGWTTVAAGVTDADGRIAPLVSDEGLAAGAWRITFGSGDYFAQRGQDAFHPRVTIDFEVHDASEHFHVPLLVTPWSFSTYRGS